MVLREVLLLVGVGVALGIAGSFATARLAEATVSGLLFGLKINDVSVIAFAALALAAVAAIAGWMPARRAARVDPTGGAEIRIEFAALLCSAANLSPSIAHR